MTVFNLGPPCQKQVVSNGSFQCVCPPDYTGRSDWVNMEGSLCQINFWAIRGLWIATLFIWFLFFSFNAKKILHILRRFFGTTKRRRNTFREMPSSIVAFVLLFFLVIPFIFVVAFIRIFDENARIGLTLSITFAWFFVRFFLYVALSIHQPGLLRKILQAENITDASIRTDIFREKLVWFITATSGWLAFVVYSDSSNLVLSRACFATYLALNLLSFTYIYFSTKNIDKKISKMLNKSYEMSKNDAILILKNKLHRAQVGGATSTSFQILIYFVWLVAPPLWVAHDYLLPLSWIAVLKMASILVDVLYINENENKQLVDFKNSATHTRDEAGFAVTSSPPDEL